MPTAFLVPLRVRVCPGIDSIHAQTARLNRTMFLPRLRTMSSCSALQGEALMGR